MKNECSILIKRKKMQKESIKPEFARKWLIPKSVMTEEKIEELMEQGNSGLTELIEIVLPYLLTLTPIRGDWIYLEAVPAYKNDGCFMFDGNTIVSLDISYTDSGVPNSTFEVINEFPVTYWNEVNQGDNFVWFNPSKYMDQILRTKKSASITDCTFQGTFVAADGIKYTLYYGQSTNLTETKIWRFRSEDYSMTELVHHHWV
jgi:hypothetical protein